MGIDGLGKILITKLYMDQSVTLTLDQKETRSVKNGRGEQNAVCRRFYSTLTANTLPR